MINSRKASSQKRFAKSHRPYRGEQSKIRHCFVWIFTEHSKKLTKLLVLQISVVPWGERRQSYTKAVGLSVCDSRLTFILSAAVKCRTHKSEVCRYLMRLVPASVQMVTSQSPVIVQKEKACKRSLQLFMFPVQASSRIFSRILQNVCWCCHYKGQDLCPCTHRGSKMLFSSYPTILPRHLRNLVNKKASGRKTSRLLWLWGSCSGRYPAISSCSLAACLQ